MPGLVTGLRIGSGTLEVEYQAARGTAPVMVTAFPTDVTQLEIIPNPIDVPSTGRATFRVMGTLGNGTMQDLTADTSLKRSIDPTSMVTLDASNDVACEVSAGRATLTVSSADLSVRAQAPVVCAPW
jgi:hypothetical protein